MKSKTTIVLIGLATVLTYFSFNPVKHNKEPRMEIHKPTIIADTVRIDTFSEANLNSMMYLLDMEHPKIVIAQAKLETGNFKSKMFKEKHNLFGFRNTGGYITYKHWKESLIRYKLWQDRNYKGGNYYVFLENIKYAEDSLYTYKLKQF